jgi:hypothetical protein
MPDVEWIQMLTAANGYQLNQPASRAMIAAAESALGAEFPSDLRELYLASDGAIDSPGQWFVVWPIAELAERNREVFTGTPGGRELVAFGDDGTGATFCTRRDGAGGVVTWSPIDGAVTDLAVDLEAFWIGWTTGHLPPY